MEFKACVKKEYLETVRGKKFYSLLVLSIGMALFAMIYVVVMQLIKGVVDTSTEAGSEMAIMFERSYAIGIGFFQAFMQSYFFLVLVILFASAISKQIKNKQWILPINAGMKPRNLILAKILVSCLSVLVCYLAGVILNFIFVISYCEPMGMTISNLLFSYLCGLIFIEFILVVTISLNAISKKMWVPIVTVFAGFILINAILGNIILKVIDGVSLTISDFTPFLFQSVAMAGGVTTYPWYAWVSAIVVMMVIVLGLMVWAMFSNKVKPVKTKKVKPVKAENIEAKSA